MHLQVSFSQIHTNHHSVMSCKKCKSASMAEELRLRLHFVPDACRQWVLGIGLNEPTDENSEAGVIGAHLVQTAGLW